MSARLSDDNHILFLGESLIKESLIILSAYIITAASFYTSYLASPDMMLSQSIFIKKFQPGWTLLLTISGTLTVIFSIFYLTSKKIICRFYKSDLDKNGLYDLLDPKNWMLAICFIITVSFYSFIIIVTSKTVNNYLIHVYLSNTQNYFYPKAIYYVEEILMKNRNFLKELQPFLLVFGFSMAILELQTIRARAKAHYYRSRCTQA